MNKLIAVSNRFVKTLDVTDVTLLKVCAAAFGVLLGLGSAKRHKKSMSFLAGLAMVGAALPLLGKLFHVVTTPEE